MKILFALSRFPYPLMKGDKLRAFQQIKNLSKNHEIHLVAMGESTDVKYISELEEYCESIYLVDVPQVKHGWNLLKGHFSKIPYQVAYFRSSKYLSKVKEIVENQKIDVVYTQLIRVVENIPFGLNTKYHLDYMDAMSSNIERRFHHSKNYQRRFIKDEKERLKIYEKEASEKFDSLSAISVPDAKILEKITGKKINIIPNGVNEDFLTFENHSSEKKYDIIFTGNMGYHPNIVAAEYLIKNILPNILEDYGPIKICLAGTNPSADVKKLANENIEVTGFVEDLRPYLANSKLFVAPLFSGSGLQNKLLESMAMGIPSFTTRLANNALGAKDESDLIVCNDVMNFSKKIIALLKNREEANKIGQKGRQYIKDNFSWETFSTQLELLLKNTVEKS